MSLRETKERGGGEATYGEDKRIEKKEKGVNIPPAINNYNDNNYCYRHSNTIRR